MLAGLPETAAAIAIILSVIVRMIRSDAAWKLVEDGEATARTQVEANGEGQLVTINLSSTVTTDASAAPAAASS